MNGSLHNCSLTSNQYNYHQIINELQNTYGFEKIGEGGFGIVLGNKSCAVKIIKNITRCNELQKEKEFYKQIELHKHDQLLGRIPHYNLYQELMDYCQFNTERINPPLSEFDITEDKTRVGYVLYEDARSYVFH